MLKATNRNSNQTLILIGGWGFDKGIFDAVKLRINTIFIDGHSPADIESTKAEIKKLNCTKKLILAGWSMGFYTAANWADILQPEKLLAISARPAYPASQLESIAQLIKRNKNAYMKKFYRDCFSPEEKTFYCEKFCAGFQSDYLENFDADFLLDGLSQLQKGKLCAEQLKRHNLTILHGEQDKIAPIEEIASFIETHLPDANFIKIDNCGHMPFLHTEFTRLFD